MKSKKEVLLDTIREYSIILDDYINKRFQYTMNTEYLEDEIKAISGALIETISEYEQIIIEEENE